jgi:hypothetical protein
MTINSQDFPQDLLKSEEIIQEISNTVGLCIYEEILPKYDVDEPRIKVGQDIFYRCEPTPNTYETPSGSVEIVRHTYQSSKGGKRYCPFELNSNMVFNSTPRFAKIVSYKAANSGAPKVRDDLHECNNRDISIRYVKELIDKVGEIAKYSEEHWSYSIPDSINEESVKTISVGLDGTCMFLINGGGWRESMVGSISLFDQKGERLHTILIGAAPEYGKNKFFNHLDREFQAIKRKFPNATTQGLADGAAINWQWLNEHTEFQCLDFWHLSEYISKAGTAIYGGGKATELEAFKESWCSYIKHHVYGVNKLIDELEGILSSKRKVKDRETLSSVAEYLKNQAHRTHYQRELEANRPIGSGITESACKTLIKSRMCQAGMRWKEDGASHVIATRALVLTDGRWQQFWNKIMHVGIASISVKKLKS